MDKERPRYAHEKWKETKKKMANIDLLGATLGILDRDIPERIEQIIKGRENMGWIEEHEDLLPQLAYERFIKFKKYLEDLKEDGKEHDLFPKAKKHINEGLKRIDYEIKYLKENCPIDTEHQYFENPKGANPEPNYPIGRKPKDPELIANVKEYFSENEERLKEETGNSDSKIATKLIEEIPELQKAIDEDIFAKGTPRTWIRKWNGKL